MKPRSTRYDIRESKTGLAVRVSPDGNKSWCYWYTFQGRKRRLTLGKLPGMTLKAAREAHTKAQALLARDIDPRQQRQAAKQAAKEQALKERRDPTMITLFDEFIIHHASNSKCDNFSGTGPPFSLYLASSMLHFIAYSDRL